MQALQKNGKSKSVEHNQKVFVVKSRDRRTKSISLTLNTLLSLSCALSPSFLSQSQSHFLIIIFHSALNDRLLNPKWISLPVDVFCGCLACKTFYAIQFSTCQFEFLVDSYCRPHRLFCRIFKKYLVCIFATI